MLTQWTYETDKSLITARNNRIFDLYLLNKSNFSYLNEKSTEKTINIKKIYKLVDSTQIFDP